MLRQRPPRFRRQGRRRRRQAAAQQGVGLLFDGVMFRQQAFKCRRVKGVGRQGGAQPLGEIAAPSVVAGEDLAVFLDEAAQNGGIRRRKPVSHALDE